MLAYLQGKILVKRDNYLIVVNNGVGYKVFAAPKLLSDLGAEAELYIYQQVKEDGTALYGFKTLEELEFFELLLSVSGIGPKSALAILSMASLADLKSAIALGNHDLLTKVSGIGQKTAERLVLELRHKVDYLAPAAGDTAGQIRGEEVEALAALGYSLAEARTALSKVDHELVDSGERIKAALRTLSK